MSHPVRYLGNDPAAYEAVLLRIFQKYPPARPEFSITIYKAGKMGGEGKLTRPWPTSAKTIQQQARKMAEAIVAECKRFSGRTIKGLMLDF